MAKDYVQLLSERKLELEKNLGAELVVINRLLEVSKRAGYLGSNAGGNVSITREEVRQICGDDKLGEITEKAYYLPTTTGLSAMVFRPKRILRYIKRTCRRANRQD